MRRYLFAVLVVLGLAQAQQDYTTSVKVLYEDTGLKFWFAGTSKRTIGPSCDGVLKVLKAAKSYAYGSMDRTGSCYTVMIRGQADRIQETDWLASQLDVRYTKRASRTTTANKLTYTLEEWTKYGESGGLIMAYATDGNLLRILSIPVIKY
jgi:hypothetical protein